LWGLGLTLLIGLSAATGRTRAGDDDTPEGGPKAKYGRGPGLMERLFLPGEKPVEKKPARMETPKADKEKAETKPVVESPATIRAREQAAWERRMRVCLKLMDLANQTNDDELYRRAEELEQRAWTVYQMRTQHLPSSNASSESDEAVLDRHLGNKTGAVKNADALTPGSAKGKDRTSQAAVREVKP